MNQKNKYKPACTECAGKQTEVGIILEEWGEERTKGKRILAFVSGKIQNIDTN